MEHNAWYQVLKRDGFIPENEEFKDFFSGDFYENLNKVLECDKLDTLVEMASKEDFLIPDRGWASYRGPMSVKKLNAMLNMLELRYDPLIDMLLNMSSPQDYTIFPLSRNFAVIAMSPAFKMCLPGAPYNIIYPNNAPSLSRCLGFGSSNTIVEPNNRILRDGTKEYHYSIQQLSKTDVMFLNSLLMENAAQYYGFANEQRVKASIENSWAL